MFVFGYFAPPRLCIYNSKLPQFYKLYFRDQCHISWSMNTLDQRPLFIATMESKAQVHRYLTKFYLTLPFFQCLNYTKDRLILQAIYVTLLKFWVDILLCVYLVWNITTQSVTIQATINLLMLFVTNFTKLFLLARLVPAKALIISRPPPCRMLTWLFLFFFSPLLNLWL